MERIALLDSINPKATEVFVADNFEVQAFAKSSTQSEIAALAAESLVLGVRSGPELSEEIFANPDSRLRAVGCYCVGTNHVALAAAAEKGIPVFNSVHENTRSVAEHVIGSVFNLMKRTSDHDRNMHDGTWTKTDKRTYEIRGKRMGIVGYGTVGSQVGVLAESMGMSVAYFDPAPKLAPYGNAERLDTLEEVLETADVVTVHVPGSPHTKNLLDETAINNMKDGSYLINTARGDVVDYVAVAAALDSGKLNGVAADVFVDEPAKNGDSFDHILRGQPNAVLTPHTAGSTVEAQTSIAEETSEKLLAHLATGSTIGSVNMPQLALGQVKENTTRILYTHRNQPGAMIDLLNRLAGENINRLADRLDTEDEIGYAAIDVDSQDIEKLNSLVPQEHVLRANFIS